MLVRSVLFSLAAVGMAAPVIAAPPPARHGVVTVINNSSAARRCYDAAMSPISPDSQALATCDEAMNVDRLTPRDIVATHVNRGILRVRAGQLASGLGDFDAALGRDPTVAEAWFNRGVALLRTARAQQALQSVNEAVERPTDRPALAYYGRAMTHEALGNQRGAYDDYRRASELDPRWDRPRTQLARFAVRGN